MPARRLSLIAALAASATAVGLGACGDPRGLGGIDDEVDVRGFLTADADVRAAVGHARRLTLYRELRELAADQASDQSEAARLPAAARFCDALRAADGARTTDSDPPRIQPGVTVAADGAAGVFGLAPGDLAADPVRVVVEGAPGPEDLEVTVEDGAFPDTPSDELSGHSERDLAEALAPWVEAVLVQTYGAHGAPADVVIVRDEGDPWALRHLAGDDRVHLNAAFLYLVDARAHELREAAAAVGVGAAAGEDGSQAESERPPTGQLRQALHDQDLDSDATRTGCSATCNSATPEESEVMPGVDAVTGLDLCTTGTSCQCGGGHGALDFHLCEDFEGEDARDHDCSCAVTPAAGPVTGAVIARLAASQLRALFPLFLPALVMLLLRRRGD